MSDEKDTLCCLNLIRIDQQPLTDGEPGQGVDSHSGWVSLLMTCNYNQKQCILELSRNPCKSGSVACNGLNLCHGCHSLTL